MRRLLLVALVLVGGCGGSASDVSKGTDGAQGLQGPQGEQGEPGPQGEQGPPGVDASPAWRWVSADDVVRTDGSELVYWDDAGVMWDVDWKTGEVVEAEVAWVVVYEASDCSSPPLVRISTAEDDLGIQRPFRISSDPEGTYRARAPHQLAERVCVSGRYAASGCTSQPEECVATLAVDELLVTAAPALGWTPPLHRARAE